jgi:hypothetical protein
MGLASENVEVGVSRASFGLVLVCAVLSVVAIALLVLGNPLAAVLTLLSPVIVLVIGLGIYALLALVAFTWGRIDAARRGGYDRAPADTTGRQRMRSSGKGLRPLVSRLRSLL